MDTERLWVQAAPTVLRRHGESLPHEEAVALVYGRAWRDIFQDLHRRWPTLCRTLEQTSALLGRQMRELQSRTDIRIHSSIRLLETLARRRPVAIVSGSTREYIEELMRLGGFARHVAFTLGTEDYPRGKPDPAPYRLAVQRAAVPPAACLAFEDSEAGVHSAKGAGVRVVGLQRDGAPPQDLSAADAVVGDLAHFALEEFARRCG